MQYTDVQVNQKPPIRFRSLLIFGEYNPQAFACGLAEPQGAFEGATFSMVGKGCTVMECIILLSVAFWKQMLAFVADLAHYQALVSSIKTANGQFLLRKVECRLTRGLGRP